MEGDWAKYADCNYRQRRPLRNFLELPTLKGLALAGVEVRDRFCLEGFGAKSDCSGGNTAARPPGSVVDLPLAIMNTRRLSKRSEPEEPSMDLFASVGALASTPDQWSVCCPAAAPAVTVRYRRQSDWNGRPFSLQLLQVNVVSGCERDGPTLRAPLSGTFLQTLPDLVTPLKGHSLFPRSGPATRSAPSERFGY